MGNYSDNESMVRMDLFKQSSKWSTTYAVDMGAYYHADDIKAAVKQAFEKAGHTLYDGYTLICLEPYHKHSHPIMVRG